MAGPASAGWAKTFTTSVCLIPPRSLWPRIQEVRVFHDKSFTRWPPHINLLYPFVEPGHFPEAAQLCREALRDVQPFQVTLGELGWFEHGPRSCTLWARPEAEELQGVQAALVRAFPQCTDLSSDPARNIAAFTPHLSLGQWRGRAEVAAALAAQQAAGWSQPASFQAGGVALIAREGYEHPFAVRCFVPFGGGEPVQLDVPYIATVGEPCCWSASGQQGQHREHSQQQHAQQEAQQAVGSASNAGSSSEGLAAAAGPAAQAVAAAGAASEFGLGAARPDGSVWSFAYGANMSPSKLSGARGIQPLESVPAQLPGWRLAFTHRGGMGNLEPLAEGAVGPGGLRAVHGVLHRLAPADYGKLINMEHEYRPIEVLVHPYGSGEGSSTAAAPAVPAVVLMTPEEKRIADGLPPSQRYLELLQEGARHWSLEPAYTSWLSGLEGIDGRQRGKEYYAAAGSGEELPALPKIRTGSQPRQGGGRGGRQGGRRRREGERGRRGERVAGEA